MQSTNRSSWIIGTDYRDGFLALYTADGAAMLYGGPTGPVPAWAPGLVHAGTDRRSVGLAYNRLIKNRYPYQRVEANRVKELREMMAA